MRALGLSLLLVFAGVLLVALGLLGLAPADAMGMAGMVLLLMGVMVVFVHAALDRPPAGGRRGRFG